MPQQAVFNIDGRLWMGPEEGHDGASILVLRRTNYRPSRYRLHPGLVRRAARFAICAAQTAPNGTDDVRWTDTKSPDLSGPPTSP